MKTKRFLSLLPLLCLLFVTSCSEEADPSFTITTTEDVTVDCEADGETTITFSSAREWEASLSSDWISCSPSSGDAGTVSITLTATEDNTTGAARTDTLTLTSVGLTEKIIITQEAMIVLEQESYSVTAEGGDLTIYFTVNMDTDNLTILGSSWMSQSNTRTRAGNSYYIALTIPANSSSSARTGYINFCKGSTVLSTITIVQEGSTAGTSTDYSADGTVTTLQTASIGNGIPIILMGDGFLDTEIADGTYDKTMAKVVENLFSEEPFTSLQDYFDIYSVTVVSQNNTFGTGYSTAFSCELEGNGSTLIEGDDEAIYTYACKVEGVDLAQALVVVILNCNDYAGTTYFGYTMSGKVVEYAVAYCPIINSLDNEYFREVLVHEAVGHGFAKLADEYYYTAYGTIPTDEQAKIEKMQDSYGWMQNVDFTTDSTSVLWATFLTDETYTSENIGIYEGACAYIKGAYRPTEESMMNSNTTGFNAPSRKAIYDRVMEEGAGLQPTYEQFVAFDISIGAIGQSLKTRSTITTSTSNNKRFARPQMTNKSLR
ncbi:MAG: M64 family metallopeptidase [Bacteroides sp.]|nr:M64 family metallopeptidase [Bacteroides sp.]